MKVLDVALKDVLRFLRSPFVLVMMFVAPLLITGIIYCAFGNLGQDGGFDMPVTRVQVVNLDQPGPVSQVAAGQMLVEFLKDVRWATFLQVTEAGDEASARAAVEKQEAGVAVIIPPDFTAAAFGQEKSVAVMLYQDPTLTLGPAIVKGFVSQFVDNYAGAIIAIHVVADQLDERGVMVDETTMQGVAGQYVAWLQSLAQDGRATLDLQSPPSKREPASQGAVMAGNIMAGMIIFFAFFSGASTAESIIREDEEGTLARLFTTPTPRSVILGGKFFTVFITLIVQLIVLLFAAAIIFGIHWGAPLAVALVTLGLIVSAAGLGVLIMSFLKNTRQTGPVMGGVLTLASMVGGLFTTGFQNLPAAYNTVALFTPHGWVLRGWKAALAGGGMSDVLLPAVVCLAMGIVFFVVGAFLFRKRFA